MRRSPSWFKFLKSLATSHEHEVQNVRGSVFNIRSDSGLTIIYAPDYIISLGLIAILSTILLVVASFLGKGTQNIHRNLTRSTLHLKP